MVNQTAGFRPATGLSDWQDSLLSQAARKQVWQSSEGATRTQQVTGTDVQRETFVKWHSYVACIKSSLCQTGVTFPETRGLDLDKQQYTKPTLEKHPNVYINVWMSRGLPKTCFTPKPKKFCIKKTKFQQHKKDFHSKMNILPSFAWVSFFCWTHEKIFQ